MMYRELAAYQQVEPNADLDAVQRLGSGVGIALMKKVFDSGQLKKTDAPLDVAISGDGFISVQMPDGSVAYTRAGTLQVNRDGLLANAQGYPISDSLTIPADASAITIGATGKVYVTVPNEKDQVEVGQIQLTRFVNSSGLIAQGENLYLPSEKTGDPIHGKPGDPSFGTLSQGYLESANVQLNDEMVNLVLAQRAYELSAKVIQTSDEMLNTINNLRR
jgi:flagellar basal-body rod protein FlgG